MAGHSRLSLSAYGGYAVVLNNPGNRYAKAAETYISSFFRNSDAQDAYSSKSIEILKDNIGANKKIIQQQQELWQEIESELEGKSLIDFLTEKYVGDAAFDDNGQKTAEVYNSPKKLKEYKTNLAAMQTIEKDLIARTQNYESTYRDVLKQLSAAVGNLSDISNINLVIAQVKDIGEHIVGKLNQAFVKKTTAILANESLNASYIDYLQRIYDSLEGSRKDTITFDGSQLTVTGDANKISASTLQSLLTAIQTYKSAIAGINANQITTTRYKGDFADFDITRFLKTTEKNARAMNDTVNGHPNYVKQFILAYHEIVRLLEKSQKEMNQAKKQTQQKIRKGTSSIDKARSKFFKKQAVKVARGGVGQTHTFRMESIENFYTLSGSAQEFSSSTIAKNLVKEDLESRNFSDAEYAALFDGNPVTDKYELRFERTGDDINRPIISQPGGIDYQDATEITSRIRKMGKIVRNLMADSPDMLDSYSHALSTVQGKIDSMITLTSKEGKTYRIAFSDKLYNAGGLSSIAISGGNLLSNLISLTSNTTIDTHALLVILLNLSSVAACYSEDRRNQIRSLLQNLLAQNFTALAFDTSNAAYENENTLYISNYSGSIVPLYSALTAINNYISMTITGMDKGSKITSPVKVEIQYADNLGSGLDLWLHSMQVVPPIIDDEGVDWTKRARWDYVASTVAAATQTRVSFDMIAFNNLYNGFF